MIAVLIMLYIILKVCLNKAEYTKQNTISLLKTEYGKSHKLSLSFSDQKSTTLEVDFPLKVVDSSLREVF